MKNIFLALIAIFVFTACSSDDDNDNNSSEVESQILGKWLFENPNTNPSFNNSFTFSSDGHVTYSYWDGGQGNNYDSETGTFSFSGEIMTMIFPEGVSLTFVQKVVYINDNVVEFQSTGVSGENAYEGDYFRDGAASYETPDDGRRIVSFDTGNVLNSAFGSSCYGLSSTDENINVKLTFLSDGVEVRSESYSALPDYQIHEVEELAGNVISVKLELLDFNPSVLDKDIIIYDIGVSIENGAGTVVTSEYLGELSYCTESRYEVVYTYNNTNDTSSIEEQTHSF
jgi:hypothetical protein